MGASRRFDLESERLETEYGDFGDISGKVRMLRTDRTILVTAEVFGVAKGDCARCLEHVRLDLEAVIEEEYYPLNADLMEAQSNKTESYDQVFRIDEWNNIDLSEAVRQSLTGAIPIAPLCKPECKGLCPVCSLDRNTDACACRQPALDPRWAALAGISPDKGHSVG